jgi:NAD(P)H-dependent flavin oxidoreductase YrpB (nitropropane dioxygenase family)
MVRTPLCDLLRIEYPIIQAPMANHTSPELVAAVTNAGGMGVHGASYWTPEEQREVVARTRALTDGPFGVNHMLGWMVGETAPLNPTVPQPYEYESGLERFSATLDGDGERPAVISTSWARSDQDLRPYFDRAHDAGALIMHMVQSVPEARRAAEAGADVIVAQGSDGGGHVGLMGTFSLVAQVSRAVAPLPVVAAGGVADGRGLVAALALGAQGVLMGTRFLVTDEAPVPPNYKRAIVDSDGHDTILTDITDLAESLLWPGGIIRIQRNSFVERWVGNEQELRRRRHEVLAEIREARARDDTDGYPVQLGQESGLFEDIKLAGQVVTEMVAEADALIRDGLPAYLSDDKNSE